MYVISFDPRRRILHLKLEGFWTVMTMTRFAAEMLLKTSYLRFRHDGFAVLSDASNFPVQSADVAKGFERIMARGLEYPLGPTAVVVQSMLNKHQASRSLDSDLVRIFLNRAEAEAWLAEVWTVGIAA